MRSCIRRSRISAHTSCPLCPIRPRLGPARQVSGHQVGLQPSACVDLLHGCCWRLSMSQSLREALVAVEWSLEILAVHLSTHHQWVHRLCVWGLSASRMADGPSVHSEMSVAYDAGRAQNPNHDKVRAQNPCRQAGRARHRRIRSCRRSRSRLHYMQ